MFIYIYLSISSNWFCKSSMRDSIFLSGSFLSALCRSKSSNSEIILTFIPFQKRSTDPNMMSSSPVRSLDEPEQWTPLGLVGRRF